MLKHQNILVAITGGSGSGKTFLAERLRVTFASMAERVSLDDFYLDRSNVPPSRRAKLNFDNPRAVDWALAEKVVRDSRRATPIELPKYDFKSHVRLSETRTWTPSPVVLWDGLWLLSRPSMRGLFDLKIFLDCPTQLRLERRLARDVAERGRTAGSVREQFWRTVIPMHVRYVAPQAAWADIILQQPSSESEVGEIVQIIRALLSNATFKHAPPVEASPTVRPAALGRPSCRLQLRHARSVNPAEKSLTFI